MSGLDAFSFGNFLHAMVSIVMLTLIHKEIKIDKRKKGSQMKKNYKVLLIFYHFQSTPIFSNFSFINNIIFQQI